jgi:hypothetical protein
MKKKKIFIFQSSNRQMKRFIYLINPMMKDKIVKLVLFINVQIKIMNMIYLVMILYQMTRRIFLKC